MKCFLILLLGLPHFAFAALGNDAGGGGNAVVCRDHEGKISSAEVLDLFEARLLHQWKVPLSSESAENQARKIADRLGVINRYYSIHTVLEKIMANARVLPPEYRLEPIEDSFPVIGVKGCRIEQLARYLSSDELLIDGEIWASLNETNKAALYLHETLYWDLRRVGASSSLRARRIVGYLMNDFPVHPPIAPSEKLDLFCSDNGYAFSTAFGVVFSTDAIGNRNATLYFYGLDGRPLVELSSAHLIEGWNSFANPRLGEGFGFDIRSGFERETYAELTVLEKSKNGLVFQFNFEPNVKSEDQPSREMSRVKVHCSPPFGSGFAHLHATRKISWGRKE